MAQDIMGRHWVCESTKLLGTYGGMHIFNVKVPKDIDNGYMLQLGDYVANEYYEGEEVSDGVAVLVLSVPMVYNTFLKEWSDEDRFYNAEGELARCYALYPRDRFTVSEEAFDDTPEIGVYVTWDAENGEYKLAEAAATSGFCGQVVKKVAYPQGDSWTIEVLVNSAPVAEAEGGEGGGGEDGGDEGLGG